LALALAACQDETRGIEATYLDSMWAWTSLVRFSQSSVSDDAMLTELRDISPPVDWRLKHKTLESTYRSSLSARNALREIREIEQQRFGVNTACDLRSHFDYSLAFVSACEARATASHAFFQALLLWEFEYLKPQVSLTNEITAMLRERSISTDAATMIDELTALTRAAR
jgi:hypothetical protein